MKYPLIAIIICNFLQSTASAGDSCTEDSRGFNQAKCTTVGASSAASAAAGIYSAKKYSDANSIEKKYTERVFQNSNPKAPTDAGTIARTTQTFTEGDRVTIGYQLSEAANRQHHIQLMESNASSERSSASFHEIQAVTAMRDVYTESLTTDADGNTSSTRTFSHSEPDYPARAYHALAASSARSNAAEYDMKAESARKGGPVPTYDFEKIVDQKTETTKHSDKIVQEEINKGGRITKIDRLPVDKFNSLKANISKARGGLVGVAVGTGLAVEEAIAGHAAKAIQKTSYSPRFQGYQPNGGVN